MRFFLLDNFRFSRMVATGTSYGKCRNEVDKGSIIDAALLCGIIAFVVGSYVAASLRTSVALVSYKASIDVYFSVILHWSPTNRQSPARGAMVFL